MDDKKNQAAPRCGPLTLPTTKRADTPVANADSAMQTQISHASHANGARAKPVCPHAAAHPQYKIAQPAQAKYQGHISPLCRKLGSK